MGRLKTNAFLYDELVRSFGRGSGVPDETRLINLERVAEFAWYNHSGIFADGALENVALEIGQRLPVCEFAAQTQLFGPHQQHRYRILHVASEVFATGGHSRVLTGWIQNDKQSSHAVILTRQKSPVPQFLEDSWQSAGAQVVRLDPDTLRIERAKLLRQLASQCTHVVLHHHPDDSIPTVAFATPEGAPVIMFNHAHFSFSLGSTVADVIGNTLVYFKKLSERSRYPRSTALLVPLTNSGEEIEQSIDKSAEKAALGVPANRALIVSVGNAQYFESKRNCDFFSVLRKVMRARPDAQVILIGPNKDHPSLPADLKASQRLTMTGPIDDVGPYYRAGDIALESFPIPSLGALVNAVKLGEAYPIPAYGPHESIHRLSQPILADFVNRSRNEAEYILQIEHALDNLDECRKTAAVMRKLIHEADSTFQARISEFYRTCETLGHVPHRIPTSAPRFAEDNRLLAQAAPNSVAHLVHEYFPARARKRVYLRAILYRKESLRGLFGAIARVIGAAFVRSDGGQRTTHQ